MENISNKDCNLEFWMLRQELKPSIGFISFNQISVSVLYVLICPLKDLSISISTTVPRNMLLKRGRSNTFRFRCVGFYLSTAVPVHYFSLCIPRLGNSVQMCLLIQRV